MYSIEENHCSAAYQLVVLQHHRVYKLAHTLAFLAVHTKKPDDHIRPTMQTIRLNKEFVQILQPSYIHQLITQVL